MITTNLFPFTNLNTLTLSYQLLKIENLPADNFLPRYLNKVKQEVGKTLRTPTALVSNTEGHFVAIGSDKGVDNHEIKVDTQLALLKPDKVQRVLTLNNLTDANAPIAASFVYGAVLETFRKNKNLWRYNSGTFFRKVPYNQRDEQRDIDLLPGFTFRVLYVAAYGLCLTIDQTFKRVDRYFWTEKPRGLDAHGLAGTTCLYCYGNNWYVIRVKKVLDTSIAEHRFVDAGGQTHDVYTWTTTKCHGDNVPWVAALDPTSPALRYTYPGQFYPDWAGAAALCRPIYTNDHPLAKPVHQQTILDPVRRLDQIGKTVDYNLRNRVWLSGQKLQLADAPIQIEPHVFSVPGLDFGNGATLQVDAQDGTGWGLNDFKNKRLHWLLDPHKGAYTRTPFDPQYIMLPESLDRTVAEDWVRRFSGTMETVAGQAYQATAIWYDDTRATTLKAQDEAVLAALDRVGVKRGALLMVLPAQADPGLHHLLKRRLYERYHLQIQCATAPSIGSFYGKKGSDTTVRGGKEKRYEDYRILTALGLLQANRKWPFVLNAPLHADLVIGIDVLHSNTGITFIYNGGRDCFFADDTADQKEKILKTQLRLMLYQNIRDQVLVLDNRPEHIVVHRDGRCFEEEVEAIEQAFKRLRAEGILPETSTVTIVEIPKMNAYSLRLFAHAKEGQAINPTVGTYWCLSETEGIVCTTGAPFLSQGTANPLFVRRVKGPLSLDHILEDIWQLACLAWSSPRASQRNPLSIKLTDDFLEPIALPMQEDEAEFGEEHEEESWA